MPTKPSRTLETVPNPHPDRDYEVAMAIAEFTCLCPITGQPDFATIRIRYVPDQHLVELKSAGPLVGAVRPRWAEVTGDFTVRGGIKTDVRAAHGKRPEIG